jgi:hypothetical protein
LHSRRLHHLHPIPRSALYTKLKQPSCQSLSKKRRVKQ